MEAVGATASVIGIATLAWQSAKATCEIIDGLVEAPTVLAETKHRLLETQNVLGLLQNQLGQSTQSTDSSNLESLLKQIDLRGSLAHTQTHCDNFRVKMEGYVKHSSESKFSTRDRFSVVFHESTIRRFNDGLSHSHSGLSAILQSLTLILSKDIFGFVGEAASSLDTQTTSLKTIEQQLAQSRQEVVALPAVEATTEQQREQSEFASLTNELQEACKRTRDAIQAARPTQKFGNMELENSKGLQGIVVGEKKIDLLADQEFGDFKATNNSKGFQGQIDSASFAKVFD